MKEKEEVLFIELLEESEYFEFTNEEHKGKLKHRIKKYFDSYKTFNTARDKDNKSVCKKVFFCDSESLFEQGGYKSQLQDMEIGLKKICDYNNLIAQIPNSANVEEQADAVVDFTKRVNNYLKNIHSTYQCYPVYGGNEGSIYLLSEKQFLVINKAINDEYTRPLLLQDWIIYYNPKTESNQFEIKRNTENLKVGSKVKHIKYGVGEVLKIDGGVIANIKFASGEKRISLEFALLQLLE